MNARSIPARIARRTKGVLAVSAALMGVAAIAALPAGAADNPFRAPLGVQIVMGPSLHPSGNDRTVENGGSGTQGKSASDPDAAYNYGADKPAGPGGLYTGDQDGNNGCGNDQDFEDDNNGNCGRARDVCEPVDTSSGEPAVVVDLPGNAAPHKANGRPFEAADCDDPDDGTSSGDDTSGSAGSATDGWSSFAGSLESVF